MSTFDHSSRLPSKLSPSRAKDFLQCPRLFYYKTILGLSTPSTTATAVGTLAHHAFERIFDHPRPERTADTAVAYVEPAWRMMVSPNVPLTSLKENSPEFNLRLSNNFHTDFFVKNPDSLKRASKAAEDYLSLAPSETEVNNLLHTASSKVSSWFSMENPQKFDPFEREKYVFSKLKKVTVHGFIDRVDKIKSSKGTFWYISDFKTGKIPAKRFEDDAFFQLEVYALCLQRMLNVTAKELRLIYVSANDPSGVLVRKVTPSLISQTERKLNSIWDSISSCASNKNWPAKAQVLCDWCPFKSVCPAHVTGLEGLLPEEIAAATGTSL